MFFHNLKYSLKIIFKNKALIFWTFAFPIILGIFFNLAFSSIENSEKFSTIDIAIIENKEFNNNIIYQEIFKNLSNENNESKLFNIKYTSKEEGEDLLNNNKITGYITFDKNPKITIKENGINETILKSVVEEITTNTKIINRLVEEKITAEISNNPEILNNINDITKKIYQEVESIISKKLANITDITSNKLSYTMIEYYTLIAMTCLYGGIISMTSINNCLANMSSKGKRVSISPVKKKTIIISSALSSYIIELLGLALLLLFTIFIIKVDFGSNIFLVILLSLVGSFAGLSLGLCLSCVLKANENLKLGIILAVTMLGCFLSGMMGITMKYIVDKNIPLINKINPANMITDGFYALYYYNTKSRFYFNIISLAIFSIILIIISIISLRRTKYDSI